MTDRCQFPLCTKAATSYSPHPDWLLCLEHANKAAALGMLVLEHHPTGGVG